MKRQPPKPTASELEILHVLWNRGPSTVREVQESLNETKDTGYTGVLKLLQIMTVKGSVRWPVTCCRRCSKAPPAS
jgi:BlaI family penicillinase repressor